MYTLFVEHAEHTRINKSIRRLVRCRVAAQVGKRGHIQHRVSSIVWCRDVFRSCAVYFSAGNIDMGLSTETRAEVSSAALDTRLLGCRRRLRFLPPERVTEKEGSAAVSGPSRPLSRMPCTSVTKNCTWRRLRLDAGVVVRDKHVMS